MLWIVLAVVFLALAVFFGLRIRKKKEMESFYGTEKKFLAICIVAMLASVGLYFFSSSQLPPQSPASGNTAGNISPSELKTDSVVIVEQLSDAEKCGENYCFSARVISVIEGDFSEGETLAIEADCPVSEFAEIEVRGEKKESGVFAQCQNISALIPMEELPEGDFE